MDARFQQVLAKATRFTASRKLTKEETEEMLSQARLVPFETLDPRLQPLNDLAVFDVRCIEYLQECFSSNQLLPTADAGSGRSALWLYINHIGNSALLKLDRTRDTVSLYSITNDEDQEAVKEIMQKLMHWLWLRLASNC